MSIFVMQTSYMKSKSNPKFYMFIRLILSGDVELLPVPANNEIMKWLAHEYKQTGVEVSEKDAWGKYVIHFSCDSGLCNPVSFATKMTRLKKQLHKYGNREKFEQQEEDFLSAEFELPKKKSELEYALNRESKLFAENQSLKEETHLLKVESNQLKRKMGHSDELEAEYLNELEDVKKLRKELAGEIRTKKNLLKLNW